MDNPLPRFLLHMALVVVVISQSPSDCSAESPFLPDLNAYNPIPGPDGNKIAFVRTGWGRPGGSAGVGRSSLISDVMVADKNGRLLTDKPLADAFIAGWTPDGTNLVCFRDWRFFLVALDGAKSQAGQIPDQESRPEGVHYLAESGRFVWLERDFGAGVVRMDGGSVLARNENWFGEPLAISPDGKWLAATSEGNLVVLNIGSKKWSDFGSITIHTDFHQWDYNKPSWDPWFADSSRLTFVSENRLVVAAPGGQDRKIVCRLNGDCGLATASPNGKRVAYVTFRKRPRRNRPDLAFAGDARVWVVSVGDSQEPLPVTDENSDSISDLRWLDADELILDRISEAPFFGACRLWRAPVPALGEGR